jgi:hypothetical protein
MQGRNEKKKKCKTKEGTNQAKTNAIQARSINLFCSILSMMGNGIVLGQRMHLLGASD